VVVRTYDLGGDKLPAPFRAPTEINPQLGWRAIRVCLDRPDIFRTQVRAALRAAKHGDVWLMIPLVTRLDELERTRALVTEEAAQLAREGIAAATSLPLGVMVETPAAAIMADRLAAEADFLSVGTNDLTQYTLAVDRGNARLAERFTPHDPSVLRLLKIVADAARRAGKPASVCGEMASEPLSAFLLIGLGFETLSVAAPAPPLDPRVGDRRASRQDRRPDPGRGPRRDHRQRPRRPRGLRDARHHGHGRRRRGDHHLHVRPHSRHRAGDDQRDRLHGRELR